MHPPPTPTGSDTAVFAAPGWACANPAHAEYRTAYFHPPGCLLCRVVELETENATLRDVKVAYRDAPRSPSAADAPTLDALRDTYELVRLRRESGELHGRLADLRARYDHLVVVLNAVDEFHPLPAEIWEAVENSRPVPTTPGPYPE